MCVNLYHKLSVFQYISTFEYLSLLTNVPKRWQFNTWFKISCVNWYASLLVFFVVSSTNVKIISKTHAFCRLQSLSYVLPSTPQTGTYSSEQTTGHSPLEASATPLRDEILKEHCLLIYTISI